MEEIICGYCDVKITDRHKDTCPWYIYSAMNSGVMRDLTMRATNTLEFNVRMPELKIKEELI